MRTPLRAILFWASIFYVSPALGDSSCPKSAEELKNLDSKSIHEICAGPLRALRLDPSDQSKAPELPRTQQNMFFVSALCESAYEQGKENSQVVFAAQGRKSGFKYEAASTLDQNQSMDEATHLLLGLHNYTNITMVALFRAGLKLRIARGELLRAQKGNVKELERTKKDLDRANATVEKLKASGELANSQKYQEISVPIYEKFIKITETAQEVTSQAISCLDLNKKPIDDEFKNWSEIKLGLLGMNFEKLVPKDLSPDPDVQAHAVLGAKVLQERQRNIYDVLNDIGERDLVYQVAEECEGQKCSKWMKWAIKGLAKIRIFTEVAPMLKKVISGVSGSLAVYKSYRQGLQFWDAVNEALVDLAPLPASIGKKFLETEVGKLEDGIVEPFTP